MQVPAPAQPTPPGTSTAAATGRLRVELVNEQAACGYLAALIGLLHGAARSVTVVDEAGRRRDDLALDEIVRRVHARRVAALSVDLAADGDGAALYLELEASAVEVRGRFAADDHNVGLRWLQAVPDRVAPLPTLALPAFDGGLTSEALHALVAVASRMGGFRGAHLSFGDEPAPRRTWAAAPGADAAPVVPVHEHAVWIPNGVTSSSTPAAWYRPPATDAPARPVPLDSAWWTRFDDLARAAATATDQLEAHLRPLLGAQVRWRLEPLAAAAHAEYMSPPAIDHAAVLMPRASEVVLAVDLHRSADDLQPLLLHALAHLAIGHVRPGDRWAHWDGAQELTAPRRQWDLEAREHVAAHWARRVTRTSLDECTASEKAQLGLWRMIGEMIGESRRLHASAERYQRAAYQRQAAQRLVAMLDEYGGAMLCDGVGLGKTYVATTVIVHDLNTWLTEHAADGRYRVTVLAPNSVVSTWQREALPTLAPHRVPLDAVRVISHTRLSRMSRASGLLERDSDRESDLEHLLLSDLVIVDEAHNFRALTARRTKVLRDLLRLQPRRERRRRVLLLTATPINNSLEDLRQECSLLFSRPLPLSDARTDKGYRNQAEELVKERCKKARSTRARGDVAGLVIHGDADARFSDAIEFRDDLKLGPAIRDLNLYLKEQGQRLQDLQDSIRAAAQAGVARAVQDGPVRIGEELLDRIVVQRSRDLCKDIERQQATGVELLFRPDAPPPEPLRYDDEYDGIEDVLRRFLPLFDGETSSRGGSARPLSLKVYMWYDVREGLKKADETSSVVGLQRILVLKRLESSPVAFLITLLRLTVLHAHRLHELCELCASVADSTRRKLIEADLDRVLRAQPAAALEKVRCLATGESPKNPRLGLLKALSDAYRADRPAADTDDRTNQFDLFDDQATAQDRVHLDRLWTLRDALVADLETLLSVTPDLADIVFGRFARSEWPRRFIAGGDAIDWPRSPVWGRRLVTDAKLRQLVARLLRAREAKQKVIVFSQFSDTIAYIRSVLDATRTFDRTDWRQVLPGLGVGGLTHDDVEALREATSAVTGDTEDRDDVVNAFAPFYRIGPWRPVVAGADERTLDSAQARLDDAWANAWTSALERRVDVLLSSDVLAEGVNLQDAALLVNFDVHWNPVRMIQRSGRIDRRLNPRIEQPQGFPDLEQLAARLGKPVPAYYWHYHPGEAPLTVNMILSDELEAELQLRERLATKTLAIDFTLGLEQGTGAEADWMASYRYQGIKSLDSFQRDRAIEQIARHHERLSRRFAELGIHPEWAEALNGWFRQVGVDQGAPLVARAMIGLQGGDLEPFRRYLEPAFVDGIAYWYWGDKQPQLAGNEGWLVLDGKTWPPPAPRLDLPWHERVAGPIKATHLLAAVDQLGRGIAVEDWAKVFKGVGRFLQQGCTAIAAPKFGSKDRPTVRIPNVFILQVASFEPEPSGDGSGAGGNTAVS